MGGDGFNLLDGQPLDLGHFGCDEGKVGALVAAAAEGDRGQVGRDAFLKVTTPPIPTEKSAQRLALS